MKILITDPIEKEAIEKLRNEGHEVTFAEFSQEELLVKIENYNALIVRGRTKVTKDIIARAKNLKVIARAGVGTDNIDVKEATKRKVWVVNAPSSSSIAVAELTFAYLLLLARNLFKALQTTKEGKWEKKKFLGTELNGKILGVIGLGRIGSEVVKRARAFRMKCIAYDPYLSKEKIFTSGAEPVDLDRLLREADFVTIHIPLTEETKGFIGREELAKLKSTAYLINCARGGIVDENALYEVLKNKKIAGAALDVFEKEPPVGSALLELDNFIATPHLGASTKEAQTSAGTIVVEQILKVFRKEKPEFVVNFF
jgi:D-3-phosphoglycerate dehydrogenase